MGKGAGKTAGGTLALIGFMGAGKSTVGPLLAERLGQRYVDLDREIEEEAGKSVKEIFEEEGESGFRERERKALLRELERGGGVISCGGGVVLRDDNLEALRDKSRIFYLRISPQKAVERLAGVEDRPLLQGGEVRERVSALMEERAERYLEAAHEVIEADEMSAEEIAEEIEARWRKFESGRRGEITGSS